MKIHLPALLILLLGAAVYLHRREVLHSMPTRPVSHFLPPSEETSSSPAKPLAIHSKAPTETPAQITQRFEAELKAQQPALLREWQRVAAEIEISGWRSLLNWSAVEESAVKRLASPKIIALSEARNRAGLSAQAYQAGIAAAKTALAETMQQALGQERAEEWQRADQRARERGVEDRVNASMRVIEDVVSLTPTQKDRLYEALNLRARTEPTGPLNQSLVLKVRHDAGILPALNDELILARDILTPEQMIQFDLAQEARKKTSQTILETFRHFLAQFPKSTTH